MTTIIARSEEETLGAMRRYATDLVRTCLQVLQVARKRLETEPDLGSGAQAVRVALRLRLGSGLASMDRELLCGALWCAGGMLALALIRASGIEQGPYLLWWTAIILGVFAFLWGLLPS